MQSHFIGGTQHTVRDLPIQHREVVRNGGERLLDMNGSYAVGQLYAMEYRLARPRSPLPVLLWHGGGMTGAQWESTPDGRQGWLWRLLEAGHDVVVCDAVERGRAGWAMFPEIYADAPVFRSAEEAWELFRIGHAAPWGLGLGEPFADQRFPHADFAALVRQMVPRWLGHEAMAMAAYDALLEQFGPCVVFGHSQGGGFAVHAARRKPHLVRAVVGLEPTGMPALREDGQAFPAEMAIPHLAVWGDHFRHSPQWQKYRAQTDAYWQVLARAGGRAEVLDLPAEGIAGNSHFCMLDTNGDEVLRRVIDWLEGLTQ
ncbi:Alpha/beta hydrolase family [Delftia tsuruhatensis]|uniref:esterase n=1 Tax=Delftia tsuruhatensis TaxID=180282 RepID=UPI001E7A9BD6|nr:esterase [Delftia tsuruhatensis]CAB5722869.1 Alpha/beta hydrolase family [Delftia tsuruhatensis]CAC9682501.1 Alpha/beta hydrolase family [Delftia tsuruhatensis]